MKKRRLIPFSLTILLAFAGCEEPSVPLAGGDTGSVSPKAKYIIGGCDERICGTLTNDLWEDLRAEFERLCEDNAKNNVYERYTEVRLRHLRECYIAFCDSLMGSFYGRGGGEYHEDAVDDAWYYYIFTEDGVAFYPCFTDADRRAAEQAARSRYNEIHLELLDP